MRIQISTGIEARAVFCLYFGAKGGKVIFASRFENKSQHRLPDHIWGLLFPELYGRKRITLLVHAKTDNETIMPR